MGVQDHPSRNLILPGALLLQNLFFPPKFFLLFIIIIIVVSGRTLSKNYFVLHYLTMLVYGLSFPCGMKV